VGYRWDIYGISMGQPKIGVIEMKKKKRINGKGK
jgi:hypothetical protein